MAYAFIPRFIRLRRSARGTDEVDMTSSMTSPVGVQLNTVRIRRVVISTILYLVGNFIDERVSNERPTDRVKV